MVVGHEPAGNVMRAGKEKEGVVSKITLLVEIVITISMAVLQGKHVLHLNSVICEPHEADLDSL